MPALYGNQKRAIKPVLKDPDSPTKKIKSALKYSPKKANKDLTGIVAISDSLEDPKQATVSGFGASRSVSFGLDH